MNCSKALQTFFKAESQFQQSGQSKKKARTLLRVEFSFSRMQLVLKAQKESRMTPFDHFCAWCTGGTTLKKIVDFLERHCHDLHKEDLVPLLTLKQKIEKHNESSKENRIFFKVHLNQFIEDRELQRVQEIPEMLVTIEDKEKVLHELERIKKSMEPCLTEKLMAEFFKVTEKIRKKIIDLELSNLIPRISNLFISEEDIDSMLQRLDVQKNPVISKKDEDLLDGDLEKFKSKFISGYKRRSKDFELLIDKRKEKLLETSTIACERYRIPQKGEGSCFIYSFMQGLLDMSDDDVHKLDLEVQEYVQELRKNRGKEPSTLGMHQELRDMTVKSMEHNKDINFQMQIYGAIIEYNEDMRKTINDEAASMKTVFEMTGQKTPGSEGRLQELTSKIIPEEDLEEMTKKYIARSKEPDFYFSGVHILTLSQIFGVGVAIFKKEIINGEAKLLFQKDLSKAIPHAPYIEVIYTGIHYDAKVKEESTLKDLQDLIDTL